MAKDELQWKKFPVLSDGFVCLVDCMGSDFDVVQAARVSYGKDVRGNSNVEAEDVKLLRYLLRHRHTTPFEMAELKFLIRVPMDCWRQWIRHRTASVNEYSTRYTEAIDSKDETPEDGWRLQSTSNKQGSGGTVISWPGALYEKDMTPGQYLSMREQQLHGLADEVYKERLAFGVAREQARKDLPLSNYTEAYWKINLHNLLHFLGLRMDSHAQKEIRDYATTIGNEIVSKLFPKSWAAFMDYHPNMGGMALSRLDIEFVQYLLANTAPYVSFGSQPVYTDKREYLEAIQKVKKLGFAVSDAV